MQRVLNSNFTHSRVCIRTLYRNDKYHGDFETFWTIGLRRALIIFAYVVRLVQRIRVVGCFRTIEQQTIVNERRDKRYVFSATECTIFGIIISYILRLFRTNRFFFCRTFVNQTSYDPKLLIYRLYAIRFKQTQDRLLESPEDARVWIGERDLYRYGTHNTCLVRYTKIKK